MAKGQRARTPIRDIAVALSMLQAEIKTAGSEGVKQNLLVEKLSDATGVTRNVFYREILRLIKKGDVVNEGGFKKYRLLVWKGNEFKPSPRPTPSAFTGLLSSTAEVPAVSSPQLALDITVHKEPPGISFLLNGVRITVNVP